MIDKIIPFVLIVAISLIVFMCVCNSCKTSGVKTAQKVYGQMQIAAKDTVVIQGSGGGAYNEKTGAMYIETNQISYPPNPPSNR